MNPVRGGGRRATGGPFECEDQPAGTGNRTRKGFRPADFKSAASTSSAIPARTTIGVPTGLDPLGPRGLAGWVLEPRDDPGDSFPEERLGRQKA